MSTKAWPGWWGVSSSPLSLHTGAVRKRVYFAAVACFAITMKVVSLGGAHWPRWRGWMVLALLGLAAAPWTGVVLARQWRGAEATADQWVRAVRGCLVPYLLGAPFLLLHDENGWGGKYVCLMLAVMIILGLISLGVAWAVTYFAKGRPPSQSTGRRAVEVAMVLVLAVLSVSAVRTWQGDIRAELPLMRAVEGGSRQWIRLREGAGRCWVDTSEGVTIERRCDGPRPQLRYVGDRRMDAPTLQPIEGEDVAYFQFSIGSMLRFRDAYVFEVDGRMLSLYGVEATSFLGDFPPAELEIATAIVWLGGLAVYLVMRRRVAAWRALPLVEVRVREDGLLTADGQRFQTDTVLAHGATVMVEDPQRLGASYRDDAVRIDRVVPFNAARWSELLTTAERNVWIALFTSLVVVGGLLAIDLLVAW